MVLSLTAVKLYREHMAEEEHRAELRLRSLGARLCTSVSSALIQFFLRIFNNMRRMHNKTIDPENNFRVIYQYTSCLLITIFFWAVTFMVCGISCAVYMKYIHVKYVISVKKKSVQILFGATTQTDSDSSHYSSYQIKRF